MTKIANIKIKPTVVKFQDETIEGSFPTLNPGVKPFGSRILVQLKIAATKTEGGLEIGDSATQTEFDNTKVARVVAIGPGAFRSRETLELWPEGEWCQVGTFVRIPLHTNSQNSWTIPHGDHRVGFAMIDDLQLLGEQPDPFYIKAWLGV